LGYCPQSAGQSFQASDIRASAGLRVSHINTTERKPVFVFYILWDGRDADFVKAGTKSAPVTAIGVKTALSTEFERTARYCLAQGHFDESREHEMPDPNAYVGSILDQHSRQPTQRASSTLW
jgi:hypothetical protein